MNGDTALAALRGAGETTPVAAVTANATPGDTERYAAQGFAGVLAKPFTPEQMRALLMGIVWPRHRAAAAVGAATTS